MYNLNVMVPVWNEEKYIKVCLRSIMKQSIKPNKVIIVDDGSTDNTPKIIKDFSHYPFFTVRRERTDKFHNYARAIREASIFLQDDADYIAILDSDTIIESKYYEKILTFLQKKPQLGLTGGILVGEDISPRFYGLGPYVYGANRVYTRECWFTLNQGKILKDLVSGVDTYHYIRAFLLGYEPEICLTAKSWSLRPTPLTHRRLFNRGFVCWKLGYYPWYIFLRALINKSPHMLAGYLSARFTGEEMWKTKNYVRFTQRERIRKILGFNERKIPRKTIIRIMGDAILEYQQILKGGVGK